LLRAVEELEELLVELITDEDVETLVDDCWKMIHWMMNHRKTYRRKMIQSEEDE